MALRNVELDRIAEQVRKQLVPYLEERGVDIEGRGKFFQCISKYHDDHDPSMHVIPDSGDTEIKCFGCLPLSQEVVTSRGILPAGEVQKGDFVFDTYGKRTSVSHVHQHKSEVPTLKMVTSIDSEGFFATADHDMLWISPPVSKRKHVRKDYRKSDKIYEVELRHLQPGMWVPLSIPEGTSDRCSYLVTNTLKTPKKKRHKVRIELDETFAFFLGLYAAEGSTSGDRTVQFSVHQNEVDEFLPIIQEIASRIGSTASIHLRKDSLEASIYICDSRLANLVDEIVGVGCENKKCPKDILFHLNPAISKAWARGVFEGNGYAKRGMLTVASKSLARAFFTATLRSGCLPRWIGQKSQEDKKDTYQVHLLENSQNQLYEDLITERVHHHVALVWVDAWKSWTLCARVETISSTGKYEIVVDITTRSKTFSCPTVSVHNCGEHMDIFAAAFHLEGKPLEDAEFIHENLFYLADKYGIPHDDIQFTAEEVEIFKARRFMRDVATIFNEFIKDEDTHKYASKRGWTPEFCSDMEIGTILDPEKFYDAIKKAGMWTDHDLVVQGLKADRKMRIPRLFGPNMLTFMVRAYDGQPAGFASRNYGPNGPKYCNTAAWNEKVGAGCRIYNKSELLYGLNLSKHLTHQRLDIFEGYSDLASARKIGLESVCAMGSTAFTTEHLAIVKRLGFTHINFVMDDDETGRKKMTGDPENLDDHGYLGVASGHEGIKVTVSMLPFGNEVPKDERDPDAYFKSHGVADYLREMVIYDAFDWELERVCAGNMTPEEILDKMIDFLGSDADFIARRLKAKKLADATNFPVDDIISEFERRFNKEADVQIEQAIYRVSRAKNTKDKLALLASIVDKLALAEIKAADLTQIEVIRDFQMFVDQAEVPNPGLGGWDTGYSQFNAAINGMPKEGKWLAIAGGANVGKCFGYGTSILMYDGSSKRVEDIKIGDLVMGDDSTPRTVFNTTVGYGELFEIALRNGDKFVCNKEHVLVLRRTRKNKSTYKDLGKVSDVTLNNYLKATKEFRRYHKQFKVSVEYPERSLSIDPYFLGLWLGDGSTNKPEITTADQEIVKYLRDYAESLGLKTTEYKCPNSPGTLSISLRGQRGKVLPETMQVMLKKAFVFGNKHIPEEYLINSRENRLKLLAGLIDSDGYRSGVSGISFTNKLEKLIDQVSILGRSLGFSTSKKVKWNKQYEREYFELYLGGKELLEIPLLLTRKYPSRKVSFRKDMSAYACKVVSIGNGTYYGFSVDNNGRFLLADFTVTHNSALCLNVTWRMARNLANENITVAYWSLDDDRHTAYAKWVAMECGIAINDCVQPHKRIYQSKDLTIKYKEARDRLFTLVQEGRLSCKGEESGNTPQMAERWIQALQDKFSNQVVLIVDSFNNVALPGVSATDERIRLATISNWFRRTTQSYNYSAIVTMEERKLGQGEQRAHLKDIFGSGKMSYDLKFAGMVYNDLHTRRDQATFFWRDEYGNKLPYLELAMEKNKLSSAKGDITFKFTPEIAKLEEIPHAIARNLRATADAPDEGMNFDDILTPKKEEEHEAAVLDFTDVQVDIGG